MNFLGVGPAELIVILVVALIFVGPERLPRLAADIARTIREIRKYTGSLAAEFNEVIQDFEKDTAGDRSQWREIGEGLTGATKSVTDAIHGARADMSGTPADAMPIAAADANGTANFAAKGPAAADATSGANSAGGPVRSTAGVSSEKWISIGEPGSGPVPGDETLYYIFTTQAINGTSRNELRFSLFDLKQNSGKGLVTKDSVLLFSKSTERITGNAKWLIAHEYGNNTFRAYPISQAGIGDPVYSAIGSDHSFQYQQNGEGYMKLGARNNLAVALSIPGSSNLIELFHLNDTTGQITNYLKIDLNEPNGQVYGVEFSPGGNKIFATVTGNTVVDVKV